MQDQASAFVVTALDPQPGERVLDACAAPGGKTAPLACAVGDDGTVVACRRPRRVARPRSSTRPGGCAPRSTSSPQDAARSGARRPFDRVLVDAPCSGIGSARRRPELLWRPRRRRLSQLARLQVAIASARRGPPAPGRSPRLLRLHVPARRDRRGVRRAPPPSARPRARSRPMGPAARRPRHPAVAAPARVRRHVRRRFRTRE